MKKKTMMMKKKKWPPAKVWKLEQRNAEKEVSSREKIFLYLYFWACSFGVVEAGRLGGGEGC